MTEVCTSQEHSPTALWRPKPWTGALIAVKTRMVASNMTTLFRESMMAVILTILAWMQYPALAPAPVGTGQPYIGQQPLRPNGAPQPAPGPLSPYNPIFNPIIGRVDPNTQSSTGLQAQASASCPCLTAPSALAQKQFWRCEKHISLVQG